jgi:site-specific recombinase XerD
MAKVKKSRGGLPPDRYLSREQIQQLRKHLDQARGGRAAVNSAIIDLMLNTGLRAAEVCQLQMRDLPHCHGKLIVDVRQGKGCVRRSVQISSVLAERIKIFVKRYRLNAKPKSYLFVNENGKQLSYRSLYSKVRIVGKAAGIGRLTAHMLRHSYSMAWYEKWKDVFSLQSQLGHLDVRTTQIYARSADEQIHREAQNFDL